MFSHTVSVRVCIKMARSTSRLTKSMVIFTSKSLSSDRYVQTSTKQQQLSFSLMLSKTIFLSSFFSFTFFLFSSFFLSFFFYLFYTFFTFYLSTLEEEDENVFLPETHLGSFSFLLRHSLLVIYDCRTFHLTPEQTILFV